METAGEGDREALLGRETTINGNLLADGSASIESAVSTDVESSEVGTAGCIQQGSENDQPVIVYKRRWYILIVFGLVSATQGGIWATWGPVATSTKCAFGWSDHTTALLANWGPITFVVGAPFFAWLTGAKGFRLSVIITAGLVMVGSGLRCISSTPPLVTWLVHSGQLVVGLAGPIAFGSSTVLSATWFPVHQRTTATAIGVVMNGVGAALPYILGPLVVSTNTDDHNNETLHLNLKTGCDVDNVRKDIMMLMYFTFAWSAFLFLLVIVYFPSKPPTPPSVSASIERLQFSAGMNSTVRNGKFWILCYCYALPFGIASGWASVLDVILNPIGVSQNDAGWLGFVATSLSSISSLILAISSDFFKRRMKSFVIICYIISLIAFTTFIALYIKLIPYSAIVLWLSIVISIVSLYTPIPLFFELAAEVNYPVPEGISNPFITWSANVPSMIYLCILMIPSVSTGWMNWCLLGCLATCIPVMCLFKENYSRLDIDTETHPRKLTGSVEEPAYLHGDVTPHPLYN